ncbi:MAG: ATP-dependent Clp protease ATP-binding subunit, partial [Cyanobacteria bacterium J06641_5]
QRIARGDVPELLQDKRLFALDMTALVAGTRFRGEFEERLKGIVKEVKDAGNIILFVDEIHTLIGGGSMEGSMDAANLLKPALARGELQCMGATTLEEYRKYIEKDAALERRFQPVKVGEPSVLETIEILQGLRSAYEAHHKVTFADEALQAAATLSERYIADRFLPDKAIDLIDEAGSRLRLQVSLARKQGREDTIEAVVGREAIAEAIASWTGIPANKVTAAESSELLNLESTLHERVIGQKDAVTAVAKAIRRTRAGIKNPDRPMASFLFCGPTGVGKTELAKALAAYLFGDEAAMVRLDMSELMEPQSVSKLIGAPPGFVGFEEGGQLTEMVRRRPYSVVLFDEVEKAHPDVFNLLLQVLEDGRLTDSRGRVVNFNNTLIIMTSNLGAKVIEKGGGGLGFEYDGDSDERQYNRIRDRVRDELKQSFRPEFLNRLDDTIVFRPLTQAETTEIAEILLGQVADRLKEQHDIELTASARFKEHVVEAGYSSTYGARPLRRTIVRLLEDPLAEALLEGLVRSGQTIEVDLDDDGQTSLVPQRQAVPQLQAIG